MGAMHAAALCFASGRGVARDPAEAAGYFFDAAMAGHVRAMFNLAVCYEAGAGVEADDQQALSWYGQAAHHGHGGARRALAALQRRLDDDDLALGSM